MRPLCLWTFMSAVAFGAGPVAAEQVRVRGSSTLETSVGWRENGMELVGRLADETGRPLSAGEVTLELRQEDPAPDPETCSSARQPRRALQRRTAGGEFTVETDGDGRFCVAFGPASRGATVRIGYAGDALHEPSNPVSLELASRKSSLELRFAPEPKLLPLERRVQTLWLNAHLEPRPIGAELVTLDLLLVLPGVPPRLLTSIPLGARERLSMEVESSRLGSPGPATLLLRSAGSETIQPVEQRVRVERTARVALSLATKVEPVAPRERLGLEVNVGSALGAVPSGSVEALVGDSSVGIAPVRVGAAHLVAIVDAPYGRDSWMTLRYLPEAPGWVMAEPLVVRVPAKLPNPWRGSFWALGVLAIGAWVLRAWRRPPRRASPVTALGGAGRAAVELVEAGLPESGWHGQVRDAHEGHGLRGATVTVVVPSFAGSGVGASASTDAQGDFVLPHIEPAAEGTRLVARSRWYATLVGPLPPPGRLVINLVLRRRALLDRLVEWARRMGRPWWPAGHEPTPRDLAGVAERQQAAGVATWADAVERAAYGPGPVDETEEQRVLGLEPHGRPRGDASG